MSGELERFDPAVQRGRIAYEHLHRYAICRDCVAGKRVLDLACGTGYGSAFLAELAAHVTGVDLNAEAIKAASSKFKARNLKFIIADCFGLPFDDNSYDVVVANEMIEHVDDHDGLISEAKRVLVDGGLFLVSTPNKPIYNRYKTPNAFHVSELELPDFRKTLERHFSQVELIGLRMALLSVGYGLEKRTDRSNYPSARVYQGELDGGRPALEGGEMEFRDPEYVQAICSTAPIDILPDRASIFYARDEDLWLEHEKIMAWASQLHNEDETLRADLEQARVELAQHHAAAKGNEKQQDFLRKQLGVLNHTIDALRNGIEVQQRAAAQYAEGQLPVIARLLSRMTDREVPSDPVAAIDALFMVNSEIIRQKAKIVELQRFEERASAAEAGLAAVTVKAEGLSEALSSAQESLASLQDKLAQSESRRDELQKRVGVSEAKLREANEEKEELAQSRDRAVQETTEIRSQLTAEQKRIAQLEGELRDARVRSRRLNGEEPAKASRDGGSVESKMSDRFMALHRRVWAQLADAPRSIADRKPVPRNNRKRTLRSRLARSGHLPNTSIFDGAWIAAQVPDLGRISRATYFRDARLHSVDPHPLFDARNYLRVNSDVAAAQLNPLQHYLDHGWREGRNPHLYFQNDWYLSQNPDVLATGGINPLDHYLQFGWKEGRWPNPVFDPIAYLNRYPDVAEAGFEPLTHYVANGRNEGREIPFQGVGEDWQRLVSADLSGVGLLDYLLGSDPAQTELQVVDLPANGQKWPPAPLNDYWLPQELRDFIISGWGEEGAGLYWFLFSVMESYRDCPEEFPGSPVCQQITERLRLLSDKLLDVGGDVPDATIIVPVYNNVLDTLLCLVTVLETAGDKSFDIIVADDGSADATQQLCSAIGGVVTHFRQPENLGFLGNCNVAARQAKGRHIVLLNNDTLVLPNWLDQLLLPFEKFNNVGLVGSKLINWDGTLQEAGGIFWQDGSAWNFGRGQDARDPEFNYLKDVDYCSGASIAVARNVWKEMDGFDPEFTPAYCEDSDLAFRMRKAGYRTIYSPRSEVVHHEGRSHGRDLSSGVKAYQVVNHAKLIDRWGELLAQEHYPNAQNVLRARDRSGNRRHVLVIDHYVPQWDQDAGSRTIYQYIRAFQKLGCHVTFWPDNLWRDPHYTLELQELGVEVMYGPKLRGGFEQFLENRSSLYDLVLVSRPHVARNYLKLIRKHCTARILYYGHDLHFRRMEASRKLGNPIGSDDISTMQSLEIEVCKGSDIIFYPDPDEIAWVKKQIGGKRKFIPNPVFVYDKDRLLAARAHAQNQAQSSGSKLLFVGGFNHTPNREGILWFVREVLPLVRKQIPGVSLDIVGSKPPIDVLDLSSGNVSVLGFVSDERLEQLYANAAVAIAPLRYGAGVKGKVIEALAYGVPVATTDIGAQGIADARSIFFLGNTAAELADAVVQACTNREQASTRAGCGVDFIERHYSAASLEALFGKLLGSKNS